MRKTGTITRVRKASTASKRQWQAVDDIPLETLRLGDHIEICTANSVYVFIITESRERYGVLMGGIFTGRPENAMLIGVESPDGGLHLGNCARLTINSRAFFYTGTHCNPGRLLTSEILGLRYAAA